VKIVKKELAKGFGPSILIGHIARIHFRVVKNQRKGDWISSISMLELNSEAF
jgi:hypothetical protein